MKRNYIIFAVVVSVITALAVSFVGSKNLSSPLRINSEEITEEEKSAVVEIGGQQLQVMVADTDAKRAKGLGGVESLRDDEGMFFIFETDDRSGPFWMKGMKMNIDIIWINDGKVTEISPSLEAPEPETSDRDLPLIIPASVYDQVLEVRAGWAARFEIKVGDSVQFTLQ